MRKLNFVLILLCLNVSFVFCQTGATDIIPNLSTALTINLGNLYRNDFLKFNTDLNIKGTPFLTDSFLFSQVWLFDKKTYVVSKMKLNLYTQQLHFKTEAGEELVTDGNVITKAIFFDDSASQSGQLYTVSCGYPKIDGNTPKTYYVQMNEGKVLLLKRISKTFVAHSAAPSVSPYKEFVERVNYYVYNSESKSIEKVKKNQDLIFSFFGDKVQIVKSYIDTNKLDIKSVSDLLKAINYYNSL
ncbi:MAG TPA: hypothetical protein VFN30_03010 [Chitinophagaceae bacterium]|nr:hypothetical protein [Chitinophagaceae bacterium]